MNTATLPAIDQVWLWLDQVPDPEIPVISLVDLGIIRDVRHGADGELVVEVTPTYSGCPATAIIDQDIEAALRAHGISRLRLERRLSPPWTSDWISAKGRARLEGYGIAPPQGEAAVIPERSNQSGRRVWQLSEQRPPIACPRCGSVQTQKVSQFGSTPCKASYRCLQCLEPFDYFKCI